MTQEAGQQEPKRGEERGPTVLVIDDIAPILRILELELRIHGYRVVGAEISERVYELIEEIKPDVVVMEVLLPQIRGMEVLRGIRQRSNVPVIFLTTSRNEGDKEEALALGANDYILKPFQPDELTYRISTVIKAPSPPHKELRAGSLVIDYGRREITLNNEPVGPSTSEWALLFALGRTPKQLVSSDEILLQVWGLEGSLNQESLPEWIERLRERLGEDLENPRIIRGSFEEGYMLDAESVGD